MSIARALARYRVRLGVVAAVVALLLSHPTPRTLLIGGVIAVAGELFRIWAAGHLEKGREVTVSGPYRFTRHPLYVGSSILGAGLAIASNSYWVIAIVVIYLVSTIGAAIRTEEAHLTEKFGAAYPDYRDGRAPEVRRRFSVERAIRNREYRAVLGLLAALALLAFKAL